MKTLIHHCRLIDGTGQPPAADAWVLIEDDRIGPIGRGASEARTELPQCDRIVDAVGCTLLPGMINLHVHIVRRHLHQKSSRTPFRQGAPYYENLKDTTRMLWAIKNAWYELTHGVTTIRDCATKNRLNIELREAIDSGLVGGPRVVACGFGIAGTGGHETHRYQGAVEADGPDEVRKAVRAEIKAGADFIKFMASGGIGGMPEHEDPRWIEFSVEELKVGVEEAHNRNKRTAAHAMGIGPVMNCLKAGIDCIEHGVGLDRHAVELMVSQGVYYIPTVSGITDVSRREAEHGNKTLARLIEDVVVKPLYESIALAHQAGVPIGAGTDTLGDMVEELKLLHRCGLTPMECIRAATSVAATILGQEADIGTIQTGKIADLVIVQGNPLEELGLMQNVRDVFKAGVHVDDAFLCGTR